MRTLTKQLAVVALAFPLLQSGATASAQDRTTMHDHLLTAGTVTTTCPETAQEGDTCDDYWFAAAIGTERRNPVTQHVNRVSLSIWHNVWATFEDGSAGWIGTSYLEGESTGGATISPNLRTATIALNDVELYAVQEDGTRTPTGDSVSATVHIRGSGPIQYLWSANTERGVYPGPLTLGHFERWRNGVATTSVNGSAMPAIDWLTYVGWYVGHVVARPGSPARGTVNGSFLNAARPGSTKHMTEVAYAEGSFGSLEIDRMQDTSDPTQVKTTVVVNGEWIDMTGNPDLQLSLATDLGSATATVPVSIGGNETTWFAVWAASGPVEAQRYYQRNRSFTDGMHYRAQSRGFFQQRPQTVSVTIGGTTYPGTGYLILDQGSYFSTGSSATQK